MRGLGFPGRRTRNFRSGDPGFQVGDSDGGGLTTREGGGGVFFGNGGVGRE
mgnify:CR=1 FL=1